MRRIFFSSLVVKGDGTLRLLKTFGYFSLLSLFLDFTGMVNNFGDLLGANDNICSSWRELNFVKDIANGRECYIMNYYYFESFQRDKIENFPQPWCSFKKTLFISAFLCGRCHAKVYHIWKILQFWNE